MKKLLIIALCILATSCAQYTLVLPQTVEVKGIKVTPGLRWNKSNLNSTPQVEVWTVDGHALNELFFVGGVASGETIFKTKNKELPMPKYKKGMLPNELENLIATTLKNSAGGEVQVKTANMRPQQLGQSFGFRFSVQYFNIDGLSKSGDIIVSIKDDKLYAMMFIAPTLHYFDVLQPEIDKIYASATI